MSGFGLAGLAGGFLAGVLSGAFGIGGGIVLVPLLAVLLGLSQHEAQGVTLAVLLLPIGLPAVVAYHRLWPIRWRLVGALVLGFLGGVGLGSLAASRIPERPLAALFVLFLAGVAFRTWRVAGRSPPDLASERPPAGDWNGLWIGAAGGLLSGLLGVGGGVLMIPLLVGVMRLGQHQAQGTSLATMLPPIGLPGVLVYARAQGGLRWPLMAAVAVGFAAGALAGAGLAARTPGPRLARAFAVFVACTAAALSWKILRGP